jgi:hypothetical protein
MNENYHKILLKGDPHSQAQWQVAQAYTKAKTCHRACLFPYAVFADIKN